jgi:RNA polymerase sigma factor (TIGR02999 family)
VSPEPASPTDNGEVARLLAALRDGGPGRNEALDRLFPLVYAELRRAADYLLQRERDGHTLQATALVHEAFLKLSAGNAPLVQDRAHFVGVAARAMRQILVDHARRRQAEKRGGGQFVTLGDDAAAEPGTDADTLVAIHEALGELATMDARLAQVVEMRFFGGLGETEIAAALDVTTRTVQRDWAKARAWLHARLAEPLG